MYQIDKVITAFVNLVGWKQPTETEYAIIDAANELSTSGRFYTDSDYVKIGFLKATQDNSSISDAQFNDYLRGIHRRAIINVLDNVFNMPDFVDRQVLYKFANNKIATESLPDGFVGYQIIPTTKNNFAFEITRVMLEFEGIGDITLRLYNSAKQTFVQEKVISVTSTLQEEVLNWFLNDTETFYRGEYFIGYNTNSTTLLPIQREYELADWNSWVKGLTITPIYSPQVGDNLFDLEAVDNVEETWGLNLDVSVFRDFTDFVTRNQRLFATAIQMQGQVISMESYLSSQRSNREERISNDMLQKILVELNGISTQSFDKQGLKSALSFEITRAQQEISKQMRGLFIHNEFQVVTRC